LSFAGLAREHIVPVRMAFLLKDTAEPGLPPGVEVSFVRGELTSDEWTFRDARHHRFVFENGRGRVKLPDGDPQAHRSLFQKNFAL